MLAILVPGEHKTQGKRGCFASHISTKQDAFIVQFLNMPLFQFGHSNIRRELKEPEDPDKILVIESHLPWLEDTNLGTIEYREPKPTQQPNTTDSHTVEKIAWKLETSEARMVIRTP